MPAHLTSAPLLAQAAALTGGGGGGDGSALFKDGSLSLGTPTPSGVDGLG